MHLNQTEIAGNDLAEQLEDGIGYLCRKSMGTRSTADSVPGITWAAPPTTARRGGFFRDTRPHLW